MTAAIGLKPYATLLAVGEATLLVPAPLASHRPELHERRLEAARPLHVGWLNLHPDASLNFQLNRWLAYGGESWLADVQPALEGLTGYDAWREAFLTLGERALSRGRPLDAALHLRAAEFFMVPGDRRKTQVRLQLTALLRDAYGVKPADRRDVPFAGRTLPAFCFASDKPRGTIVAFGGFDSYIEEFFPIFIQLRDRGWSVVAFEGPGQGEVLEDRYRSMTPHWHKPVAAVLDAYGLDDVTLLGISLGGCLAIRAAAFEPRVKRVIAFDAMTDFLACMLRQLPPAGARAMQWLLRVRARWIVNAISRAVARRRPVVEWGLVQAMHVLGRTTPFDVFEAAAAFRTGDISDRVRQDVLLLAGADDHYVPLEQIRDQAALLTAARSVTSRVFSRADDAQAHCQVGNLPLAIDVMADWLEQGCAADALATAASRSDAAYKQEAPRPSMVQHAMYGSRQTQGRAAHTMKLPTAREIPSSEAVQPTQERPHHD